MGIREAMTVVTRLPVLFVGSAAEDLPVAKAVQQNLDRVAEVELWSEGQFVPMHSALDSLLSTAGRADYGLFIATSVDTVSTRGAIFTSARDNVLFELGIFLGQLGPDRSFLLQDRNSPPRLPSDLGGVTNLTYDGAKSSLRSAVGAACTEIEEMMTRHGNR